MNKTGNILQNNFYWDEFLSYIEEFAELNKNTDSYFEIINSGLSFFHKFPCTETTAVFLTNSSFEFEFRHSIPIDNANSIKEIFSQEIDNGTIGNSIENSKTIISDTFNNDHKSLLLVPLTSSNVTLGIVLVVINTAQNEIPQILIRLTSLLSSLYANSIENSYNLNEKEVSNILLEQKISQRTQEIENSKREINAILDAVHNGIIVADNDNSLIIKSNPVAEKLIHCTSEDLHNISYTKFLDDDSKNSDLRNYESILIAKSGKRIPILRTTAFLKYGKFNYRIESFFDITEIKEAEKKLQEYNELLELKVQERTFDLQLLINKLTQEIREKNFAEREMRKMLEKEKELNQLKSKFVAMVSHEFRTPLTIIKSSTQLLLEYHSRFTQDEIFSYLNRIVKTVDNMTLLIDNALFVSKAEKNKIKPVSNRIDVVEIIDEIIRDIKVVHTFDRIINVSFDNKDSFIECDENLLRLIVSNLITNAIKYSAKDEPVDIILSDNSEDLYIEVCDKGIGIPEEEQNHIFELFYRAKNVGNISGTGLGMAVIMESLKLLGGKIELTSTIGEGSIFKVIISKKVNNGVDV